MNVGEIFRRAVMILFAGIFLSAAVIVGAAVQIFDGQGRYVMSEFETEAIAKQRAQQKAVEDAQDKAGVYLTSFSKSVNAHLTVDEISAVTNNIITVSDVKIESTVADANGEPVIVWMATLKASIDPDGIYDFAKREGDDRYKPVYQNNALKQAVQKNDAQVADLKNRYNRAASQSEKAQIREQMKKVDREFLANQKIDEADRLAYSGNFNAAIKLYDEAIKLDPNSAAAYNNRGNAYQGLAVSHFTDKNLDSEAYFAALNKSYEKSFRDYNKAIELDPKYAEPYVGRGEVYFKASEPEAAVADFSKAIALNPNYAVAYYLRAYTYHLYPESHGHFQGLYEDIVSDCNKALELDPDLWAVYLIRGANYRYLGEEAKSQVDLEKYTRLEKEASQRRKQK